MRRTSPGIPARSVSRASVAQTARRAACPRDGLAARDRLQPAARCARSHRRDERDDADTRQCRRSPKRSATAVSRRVHAPYHDAIERLIDERLAAGRATTLVAVHSFTPVYRGVRRPWEVGIVFDRVSPPCGAADRRAQGGRPEGRRQPALCARRPRLLHADAARGESRACLRDDRDSKRSHQDRRAGDGLGRASRSAARRLR